MQGLNSHDLLTATLLVQTVIFLTRRDVVETTWIAREREQRVDGKRDMILYVR